MSVTATATRRGGSAVPADDAITRLDRVVAAWMLLTVVAFYANFLVVQSTALTSAAAVGSYGLALALASRYEPLRHLVAVGTVAGLVELAGDAFLVAVADSLVYPATHPMLWASPAYMPLAWAVLVAFIGYLALRLHAVAGLAAAVVGPAVFAFVSEAGFESFASHGGGWTYVAAPAAWVGNAPLFVLVAEAAMFATTIAWVRRDWVSGGLGMGASIVAAYAGTYWLFATLG